MPVLENALFSLRRLEDLSFGASPVHRLHPLAKLAVTAVFVAAVASFPRHELTGLAPFLLYPAATMALADLPFRTTLSPLLLAAPFVLLLGAADPFFDRVPLYRLGSFPVAAGWVSFASLLLRFFLSLTALLVLVATTGLVPLCASASRFRFLRLFASVLYFVYRYSFLTIEEAARMVRAHGLRAAGRGIRLREWGGLAGHLLLRAFARGQRVHWAMLCRGFAGPLPMVRPRRADWRDILYFLGWAFFFAAARFWNLPRLLGGLILGGGGS